MTKSKKNMTENVQPIKSTKQLHQLEHELLIHGKMGMRNLTEFLVSMKCLLRVSDVITLRYGQIYKNGKIRSTILTKDQKTKKHNILDLNPLRINLENYQNWLLAKNEVKRDKNGNIDPDSWLFPSSTRSNNPLIKTDALNKHVSRFSVYQNIKRAGDLIGLHCGTHTARKTGSWRLLRSCNSLPIVMRFLNHSRISTTLLYLGITSTSEKNAIENVSW